MRERLRKLSRAVEDATALPLSWWLWIVALGVLVFAVAAYLATDSEVAQWMATPTSEIKLGHIVVLVVIHALLRGRCS